MKLTKPLFTLGDFAVSGRDIVLFLGGLFLIYKATTEIHAMTQPQDSKPHAKQYAAFGIVLLQIMVLDIVFSLDSVITAVGMVDILPVMIIAIIVSMFVMLFVSQSISRFIESNPSIKILALAFLILVGVTLVADSMHFHIPKGYIYFAIAFSLILLCFNSAFQISCIHNYYFKSNSRIFDDKATKRECSLGAICDWWESFILYAYVFLAQIF